MSISVFLTAIKAQLSKEARLLSDPNAEEFKSALARWTDRDWKTPSAIVVVAEEEDIVKTVRDHLIKTCQGRLIPIRFN